MSQFLYGNPSMIDAIHMAITEDVRILDCSKIVFAYGRSAYVIIEIEDEDLDKLLALGEEYWEESGAWFRTVGRANTWFEPKYRPKIMRKVGIHEYICDAVPESIGASQPRNVAAVIGEIANYEGKTPIELFNSL